MCRLVAYCGNSIALRGLLFDPNHSLYKQSWQPKEMNYAKLNADGFGFGWYNLNGKAVTYRNPAPIWTDINLETLSDVLHAPLWLAMVRSATAEYGTSPHNLQPFTYRNYLFMHNGFIRDFNQGILQKLIAILPTNIIDNIRGLTDSEYLFGLICYYLNKANDDLQAALTQTIEWCKQHLSDHKAMLNIILSDGIEIVAVRLAINETPPTLYLACNDQTHLPEGAKIIASEPFSETQNWQEILPGEMIICHQHQRPRVIGL